MKENKKNTVCQLGVSGKYINNPFVKHMHTFKVKLFF